jgi:hypothetical protein
MRQDKLNRIIKEEITKAEVNSIVSNKIDSELRSNDFKKKVKEITAAVISDVFKVLWQRNNVWKGNVVK